jgi:1-deoxy-D-xylulose-5-phosphate reductoisomerase
MKPKKVAILGSTGSIGQNVLKVIAHLSDRFQVVALGAKSNIALLEKQARAFHPKMIAVFEQNKAKELQQRLPNQTIVCGMEGLEEVAAFAEADIVVSAMSGTVGIVPTARALQAKKTVALANKEALVSAGECLMRLSKENQAPIIPIDSEHSALFQCLHGQKKESVKRLILTASGGPFHRLSHAELDTVTLEQALSHPTWNMGQKITIDSSTLMNKGLEAIEAHILFGVPMDQIAIVIHPQSVIHSMVEFEDASMLAQLSEPNMITPIQYALTYPQRAPSMLPYFDFTRLRTLDFIPYQPKQFLCLDLALSAGREGGSMPCYMNGANEVLVHRFLSGQIGWKAIGQKLEKLMQKHKIEKNLTLDNVLAVDREAREEALKA